MSAVTQGVTALLPLLPLPARVLTPARRCRSSFLCQVSQRGQEKNVYVVPGAAGRGEYTVRLRGKTVPSAVWSDWSTTLRLGESRPTSLPASVLQTRCLRSTCLGAVLPPQAPGRVPPASPSSGGSRPLLLPLSVETHPLKPVLHPLLCFWGPPTRRSLPDSTTGAQACLCHSRPPHRDVSPRPQLQTPCPGLGRPAPPPSRLPALPVLLGAPSHPPPLEQQAGL